MPLPSDVLESIKGKIDEAKGKLSSLEDVLTDMRASGIDSQKQEDDVRTLKGDIKRLELFYGKQTRRHQGE